MNTFCRHTLAVFGAMLLGACASPPPASTGNSASLVIHVHNDAQGALTLKGAQAFSYANPECDKQERIYSAVAMSPQAVSAPLPIPGGQPFTFGVTTMDGRFGGGGHRLLGVGHVPGLAQ